MEVVSRDVQKVGFRRIMRLHLKCGHEVLLEQGTQAPTYHCLQCEPPQRKIISRQLAGMIRRRNAGREASERTA
jgi:hypothetical protein